MLTEQEKQDLEGIEDKLQSCNYSQLQYLQGIIDVLTDTAKDEVTK